MYKELVERLRKMYTFCAWDELKDAANVIETLLSENIELKRSITFLNKNTLGKLRAELDRLRHERDQAVEELHRNTDAVPVVRCKDCVMYQSSGKSGLNLGWCPVCSFVRWGDDFCSYGERKESNE